MVNQHRGEMKDNEQKEKVSERSRNRVYRTGGGKGGLEEVRGLTQVQEFSPLPIHSRLCQYKEGVCELFQGCLMQDQSQESLV